jgi:uncharacterized lipoprotein YehR (DUF1307 family)
MKISKGVIALIVIAVFAVGLVACGASSANSTQSTCVTKQTALNAQYQDNQNQLSAYTLTIKEGLGIANVKSAKGDEILSAAVTGRYDNELAATTPGQAPQLISALSEAYPDISWINVYDKLVDEVRGGREAYKNVQSKFLDMIRDFDSWRQAGLVHSRFVSIVGCPNDNLEARIGTTVKRGPDALEQMKLIVNAEGVGEQFTTGVAEPLIDGTEGTQPR